ncbi:hypothetical protein [Aneurinibacillus migulanus]|uniref:hypothetical protein n=1 Tax=Aneurinibacillus migulanus TaxID=47500 RepID=UPI00209F20EF|nr:hypothetical protein [Aneurinibacillus migulanus]MCP1358868.1 hypothetical protein [Aneurinibacillus migulanus]
MTRLLKGKLSILLVLFLILLAGCQQNMESTNQADKDSSLVNNSSTASDHRTEETTSNQTVKSTEESDRKSKPTAKTLTDVQMGKVTAVRSADSQSGWIGGEGWIAKTENGGESWNVQYRGTGTINQLFALNGKDVWATLGQGSKLLGSTNGGRNWTVAGKVPNDGFLHFVSKEEGFSANERTTDGGKTWTPLPIPKYTVGDAYFHDREHGWAVTQGKDEIEVKRTIDGGKTWRIVMSRKTVEPLSNALIRSAGTDDAWIECIGGSGMTQTSYSLFHTSNGGQNWQTVLANSTAGGGPAPGFPMDYTAGPKNAGSQPGPLYVVNRKVTFMGGRCMACDKPNTIGWTKDGGKTWVNGNQSFDGYGEELVAFADADHGWLICTDNTKPSEMYTTSDGGKHWRKTYTFERPKQAS